jgi:hypothetical protein
MTLALSILGFGLLFALFGVLQLRRPGCSGNCGACSNGCATNSGQDDQ